VAGPVTPADPADRERAIAAAKVAVRHQTDVVPLAGRRRQELPRFLAVAAAVLLVLLAAGFLVSRAGDDGGDYAGSGSGGDRGDDAAAEAADEPAATSLEQAGAGESGGDDSDSFSTVERLPDLGAVADDTALLTALDRDSAVVNPSSRSLEPSTSDSDSAAVLHDATAGDSEACQAALEEADTGLSGLLVQASADYAGTRATVYVFATAAGGQRIIAVSDDGCRVLTTLDL
jgi:hypothetical protein